MKNRLVTIVFLCLVSLPLFANHIRWMGDYSKALRLAISEQKPLLVLVIRKNSPHTQTVLKRHLMNQPYIDQINQRYISVLVTYEGTQSYPVEMYYTTQFPALFFVDSSREIFLRKPLYADEIEVGVLRKIFK